MSMNIGGLDALRLAELRRAEARAAQLRADIDRSAAEKDVRRAEASGGPSPQAAVSEPAPVPTVKGSGSATIDSYA